MKEALFYEKIAGGKVKCHLCPHECVISDGKRGICRIRENRGGGLIALTFERPASLQMDPIEKKPLYHFHPGSQILSVGTSGCNLSCAYCQNWSLVESEIPTSILPPDDLPKLALKYDSIGIAYTYNEPLIWYEYLIEAGSKVKNAGLYNVLVTNGFINPEPLDKILPLIDAMNIDLKSIRDLFYKKNCKGMVDPVKDTIRRSNESCLVEVTNLVIPDENDSKQDIAELVNFIADVNPDIPLHFSRYFPHRSFPSPPTPPEKLIEAYEIAIEKLNYVYIGNIVSDVGQNSLCPNCGETLVERLGYSTHVTGLSGNRCRKCKTELNFAN